MTSMTQFQFHRSGFHALDPLIPARITLLLTDCIYRSPRIPSLPIPTWTWADPSPLARAQTQPRSIKPKPRRWPPPPSRLRRNTSLRNKRIPLRLWVHNQLSQSSRLLLPQSMTRLRLSQRQPPRHRRMCLPSRPCTPPVSRASLRYPQRRLAMYTLHRPCTLRAKLLQRRWTPMSRLPSPRRLRCPPTPPRTRRSRSERCKRNIPRWSRARWRRPRRKRGSSRARSQRAQSSLGLRTIDSGPCCGASTRWVRRESRERCADNSKSRMCCIRPRTSRPSSRTCDRPPFLTCPLTLRPCVPTLSEFLPPWDPPR